jgi:hypothetical protein
MEKEMVLINSISLPTSSSIRILQSMYRNHRVMKWIEGAKERVVVAGGQGKGIK